MEKTQKHRAPPGILAAKNETCKPDALKGGGTCITVLNDCHSFILGCRYL